MQRRSAGCAQTSAVPSIVHEVLRSPGQPLDPSTRTFMEPRFGHDFSQVRVHADSRAAQSSRAVNALAYTVGRDVVIGDGGYASGTSSGKSLLAHELAHVVQQGAVPASGSNLEVGPSESAMEAEADAASGRVLRGEALSGGLFYRAPALTLQRQGVPESSRFKERVVSSTHQAGTDVWTGEVERTEVRDKPGGGGKEVFHRDLVPVRYDEKACQVTIPLKVAFADASAEALKSCPPSVGHVPRKMDSTARDAVASRYVSVVNDRLNDWYSVRMESCKNACAGKNIAIKIEVTRDESSPDYTVMVSDVRGRSCVTEVGGRKLVVLHTQGPHGGDISSARMAHEGVHMALGTGDEYKEKGKPIERVRENDWSLMSGHDDFKEWALLHERHFAFVPAFLNNVRPGCNARLQELARPTILDLKFSIQPGYVKIAGERGMFFDLGLDLGIPLNRLRTAEAMLGVHGRAMLGYEGSYQYSFLLGLRAGLSKTLTPSSGGLTGGIFGEAGAGKFTPGGVSTGYEARKGAYLEAGGSLGYSLAPERGKLFSISAEAAAGTGLGLRSLETGSKDPLTWYRVGLTIGWKF